MLLVKWKNPENYAGFEPSSDYLLLTACPLDTIANHSNFDVATQLLTKKASKYPAPTDPEPRNKWVYTWSASCSVRVHVDYLMVRGDAPQSVVDLAESLLQRLEAYPVLDDDHYFEKQYNQMVGYWRKCSARERQEFCQQHELDMLYAALDLSDEVYTELLDEFV